VVVIVRVQYKKCGDRSRGYIRKEAPFEVFLAPEEAVAPYVDGLKTVRVASVLRADF
jgi:hypothetical protein